MTATTKIEIETLAKWGQAFEVQTKHGPRMLRKAKPDGKFWDIWRAAKDQVKAAGVSCSRDINTGQWEVCWWLPVDAKVMQERREAVELSQAASSDVFIPVPEGLDYLPYQKAGINYALKRDGVLIADEMGLGKTIQAIGIINADERIKKVIVVCPASLKINWKRELDKWLVRPMTVGVAGKSFPSFCDVVVINYDILGKYEQWIAECNWDMVVLDEAHLIKNPKAKRTVAALGIKSNVRRVHLTGTPICNRPAELYTIIKDLHPKWSNKKYFKRYQYTTSAERLNELNRILRETCMVRRLKMDVLTELPPKVRQVVEIDISGNRELAEQVDKERKAYSDYLDSKFKAELAVEMAKISESEEEYKAAVEAMREVSVAFEMIAKIRHQTALVKTPAAMELIAEQIMGDEPKKLVIFAHHRDVVDLIMETSKANGWNPVRVTGSDNMEQRQLSVDKFMTDPNCMVFVGNIKAAGVGLTLTSACDVAFIELDWVPGNVTQAEDRCHRIGQKSSVHVRHIVLSDSLDANMAKTLIEKQAIIDAALDQELSQEELEERKAATIIEVPSTAMISREAVLWYEKYMTDEIVELAHTGIKVIAFYDPDGAREENNIGFNKYDSAIGHNLARLPSLTKKQAFFALKLANKYRRQMPELADKIIQAWKDVTAKKALDEKENVNAVQV